MPRYIEPGPLATNKRLTEWLFGKAYALELEGAIPQRVSAYRRAAAAVDEWPENVASILTREGPAGLRTIPSVGERLAVAIAGWLNSQSIEGR